MIYASYAEDPTQTLATTFEEVDGYDEMIVLSDIRLESHASMIGPTGQTLAVRIVARPIEEGTHRLLGFLPGVLASGRGGAFCGLTNTAA